MLKKFSKWQGCGNDFVLFDCLDNPLADYSELAKKVCDRHYGIGADGILIVEPSSVADFRMRIINTDGSEAEMCGNGIRCFARYLYDNQLVTKEKFTVETGAGILVPRIIKENNEVIGVRVDMGEPHLLGEEIPVIGYDGKRVISEPLQVEGNTYEMTCVSMGNPHCVIFVEKDFPLWDFDIESVGKRIENDKIFPEKVNVEFVKTTDKNTLEMRVWERGSGETYACGTGACASVAASCARSFCKKGDDITVHLKGGELVINYYGSGIKMTGGAVTAYTGSVEIQTEV